MTSERPEAAQADNGAGSAVRVLRRRSSDRVIGGVASGLGDFLNVDPLLIRIAFVGLMVFGGLGLILYVLAWLLLPDESSDDSIAEQLLSRVGFTPSRLGSVLLILIGGVLLAGALATGSMTSGNAPTAAVAVVILVSGVILLRQGDGPPAMSVPGPTAELPRPAAATVSPPRTIAVRRRQRRAPSPLGWYVIGAAFAAVGLVALGSNVSGATVSPGQFFGVALGVLGIGLIVGTWWGSARLLVLVGILLVPLAVAASFVTVPIEGGFGYHRFRPANVEELRGEYRLVGGSVVLDLTQIQDDDEPIVISASVAVGEVFVALPPDASFELDAAVGGGTLNVLGDSKDGTSLEDRYVRDGSGQHFILDLGAGFGTVYVENCCAAVNR